MDDNHPELGVRGVKELWDHAEEIREVLEMCIWSIKKDVVDQGLGYLFMISVNLVRLCPPETCTGLRSHWIRLLTATARGWERQLCSDDSEDAFRKAFPYSHTLM